MTEMMPERCRPKSSTSRSAASQSAVEGVVPQPPTAQEIAQWKGGSSTAIMADIGRKYEYIADAPTLAGPDIVYRYNEVGAGAEAQIAHLQELNRQEVQSLLSECNALLDSIDVPALRAEVDAILAEEKMERRVAAAAAYAAIKSYAQEHGYRTHKTWQPDTSMQGLISHFEENEHRTAVSNAQKDHEDRVRNAQKDAEIAAKYAARDRAAAEQQAHLDEVREQLAREADAKLKAAREAEKGKQQAHWQSELSEATKAAQKEDAQRSVRANGTVGDVCDQAVQDLTDTVRESATYWSMGKGLVNKWFDRGAAGVGVTAKDHQGKAVSGSGLALRADLAELKKREESHGANPMGKSADLVYNVGLGEKHPQFKEGVLRPKLAASAKYLAEADQESQHRAGATGQLTKAVLEGGFTAAKAPKAAPAKPAGTLSGAQAIERLTARLPLIQGEQEAAEVRKQLSDAVARVFSQLPMDGAVARACTVPEFMKLESLTRRRQEALDALARMLEMYNDPRLAGQSDRQKEREGLDEFETKVVGDLNRQVLAAKREFFAQVEDKQEEIGRDFALQGIALSPKLRRVMELTALPDLQVPWTGNDAAREIDADGFDREVSAYLTRMGLASGAELLQVLGAEAVRALPGCADPVLDAVGLNAARPADSLVAERTKARAPEAAQAVPEGQSSSLADLARGASRLPKLAGPVWVVTTAPGSLGASSRVVASKGDRTDAKEFLPWSPEMSYESAVSKFSTDLTCAAAQKELERIRGDLRDAALGTVAGGKITQRTVRAFFELVTGGVDRFTSSTVSAMSSLTLDMASITLASGGRTSRLAGLGLDVLREAPLDSLREGMQGIGQEISEAAAKVQEKLGSLLEQLPENVQEGVATTTEVLGSIWETFKEFCSDIKAKVARLWEKMGPLWDKISGVCEKVAAYLPDIREHLDTALRVFLENVADLWERLKNLQGLFDGLQSLLSSALEAAASSVPLKALKEVLAVANQWAAEMSGKFFMKLKGGEGEVTGALNGFKEQLSKLQDITVEYALSRSLREVNKPQVGQKFRTCEPVLAFRDQAAAIDYAINRAKTEPGDRHLVLSRIDLNDQNGRELGPLAQASAHSHGQNAVLLAGAELEVTQTEVVGGIPGVGAVELNLLTENLDPKTAKTGLAIEATTLANLSWLKEAPESSSGVFGHLLGIGTSMHAVHQISGFVMEYYQGDMERFVREVLGETAAGLWTEARDRYATKEDTAPKLTDELRAWATTSGARAIGLNEGLAQLVGNIARGDDVKSCLKEFRTALKAEAGQESSTKTKIILKSIELLETALDKYQKHKEKQERMEQAQNAALVIGAALGMIETIIKVGPETIVDKVLSTGGFTGAVLRSAVGQRVIGGYEGYTFNQRTNGTTAAVTTAAVSGGLSAVHSAALVGERIFGRLSLQQAGLAMGAVQLLVTKYGGLDPRLQYVMNGAMAGLTFVNAVRPLAKWPDAAVSDVTTLLSSLAGGAASCAASGVSAAAFTVTAWATGSTTTYR
ncbi:hypothetical protein [Streptomyces sp. HUAS TT7]|uniref:hypothetical protein n=1 Tax=Streptomyces sp. HUAS TT7 TaxID=3447507 RepID=UPI003F65F190